MRGTLLAFHRIGIDVVTREAVFRGNQIGRDALRHEIGREVDRRVHVPGTARHAHADARHAFHAACNDDFVRSCGNLAGGEVDGIESRRTEARDLHARRLGGVSRLEGAAFGITAPASMTGSTQPMMMSSTVAVSSPLRSRIASSVLAARRTDGTSCRLPSFLPRPRGVRTWS